MKVIPYFNDRASKNLYRAGGYTAILFIIYSCVSILILIFLNGGYPENAVECFTMIQENRFIALLRLDIVSVLVIPFYCLLFYSLYQALRKEYEMLSKIALFCILAGVTIFMSGVNIASILTISDKYHSVSSPEMKQQLLAACEGMLVSDMWINTGAIIRGILIESGALIFSIIMLKTLVFNKITGWVGILTHGFDLSSIVCGLFYPPTKEIFTAVAGPLYVFWFVLVGARLLHLSRTRDFM